MASSKEYLNFILDCLSELDGITTRQMMGEYLIYYRGKYAAAVCDDRFLVKPVPSAKLFMPDAVFEKPYDGAKEMILADNVEDRAFMKELFEAMYEELPCPKKQNNNLNKGNRL